MHLLKVVTVLTSVLASGTSALDYAVAFYKCRTSAPTVCVNKGAYFKTSSSHFVANLNQGCHGGQGVPNLQELCMDWGRSRAKFRFNNQGWRCMVINGQNGGGNACRHSENAWNCGSFTFTETACTWATALGDDTIVPQNETTPVDPSTDPRYNVVDPNEL